jgi:hypothetical protein
MQTITIHYQAANSSRYESVTIKAQPSELNRILSDVLAWRYWIENGDGSRFLLIPQRVTGIEVGP